MGWGVRGVPGLMEPHGCLKGGLATSFLMPSPLGMRQSVSRRCSGAEGVRHLSQLPEIVKSTPLSEEESSPASGGKWSGEQGGRVSERKGRA